jgi:hypothetical protein
MLTAGEVIGRAFRIYREQFVTLFGAALIIFLLELVAAWAFWILAGLVSLILGVFYQGMVVGLVRDVQDGRRDSSMGELFSAVTPVALRLLVVAILFGLGVAIGFILLIVPGLILLTIWAVVAPVTVIERPGIFAAFGRSRELVRGHGWTVFGVIVLIFLISVGVSLVAAAVGAPLGDTGRALVQWIAGALTAPLAALAASVLYFALAERTEPAADAAAFAPPSPGGA